MRIIFLFVVALSWTGIARSATLQCNIGPIYVTLAEASWQVTSCSDNESLVFATVDGNPAMPFVFFVDRSNGAIRISGEGTGSKEYTSAAFEQLQKMDTARFDELVSRTKSVGNGDDI